MKQFSLIFVSLFLAACGSDISSGSQGVGQQCFFPSDCQDGLSCYNRVCAPIGGGNITPEPDAGSDMTTDDTTPLPDTVECVSGESRCLDEVTAQVCVNGSFFQQPCENFCSDGQCVDNNQPCEDNDGDGYGFGCELGSDCDDNNARVNPGQRESCDNRIDDNCNGQINESCEMECCPGGCGDQEFCNNSCECVEVDPNFCQYQEQPCNEGGPFNNGFVCAALNDNAPLRCYGLCDKNTPNPDATCPEDGSVCSFGDENQGICLSSCNEQRGCPAEDNGCLKLDGTADEGICVPVNPDNQIGDRCDSDLFFDCEENSYCLDLSGNGRGECVESCRPFAHGPGGDSDCSRGHCLPLSADIGMCVDDNGQNDGDNCRSDNTSCSEDAVGCYQGVCQRVCRLNLSGDCLAGERCRDFGGDQGLGVCR